MKAKPQTPSSLGLAVKSISNGKGTTRKELKPTGCPPEAVRSAYRHFAINKLPILEKIVDNDEAKDADRINAVLGGARVGLSGESGRFAAGQVELPEGTVFKFVIGERDISDD